MYVGSTKERVSTTSGCAQHEYTHLIEADCLNDRCYAHNDGDGKALELCGTQRVILWRKTSILVLGDIQQEPSEQLGLQERKTILDNFEILNSNLFLFQSFPK